MIDFMSVQYKHDNPKSDYMVVFDRASGFVLAKKLTSIQTIKITNQAISSCSRHNKEHYTHSAALNPEGNREAKATIKREKRAITHTVLAGESQIVAVAKMTSMQKTDSSGTAAVLFFNRRVWPASIRLIPERKKNFIK